MTEVRYYIKHGNGRERIEASNDVEALAKFHSHWTADAVWNPGTKPRILMRETKEILHQEESKVFVPNHD